MACEIQLRLLILLGVATEASLWRSEGGHIEPLLALGEGAESRRARATAKAALRRGGTLSLLGPRTLRAALVRRFRAPAAAIVARVSEPVAQADAYLAATAAALSTIYERELLLERSAERERVLVSAGEQRLMRIGFDLHDGPIQDVLSLGGEVSLLRDQIYPFIQDTHRERAAGRFDDVLARVTELDRHLREISRSLESRSIITRPLGESLHREVDAFAERTGIDARLEIRGDPESLTSAQRIAVYRAIQESLSNVREHSGASTVEIRVRMRRASIEVRVTDDGHGFEVGRALARAAQRGRLGIVGIGERVRMLGGTFEIDSAPGGPTMLTFALPRVTPTSAPLADPLGDCRGLSDARPRSVRSLTGTEAGRTTEGRAAAALPSSLCSPHPPLWGEHRRSWDPLRPDQPPLVRHTTAGVRVRGSTACEIRFASLRK